MIYGDDGLPGLARTDDDGGGTPDAGRPDDVQTRNDFAYALVPSTARPDPNEIGALGSDDAAPLRAVSITVRFYDPASDQMREVAFRHSLIDVQEN